VSDLIIQAGERQFRVHKNILATRSPVFAQLISELEDNTGTQVCHSIVEETEEDIIAQTLNTDDHDTKEETKETNHDRAGGGDFADCDEKVLDTEKEEKMKKLVITDLSPQTVGHILNYIYTDSMDNIDTVSPDLLAGSDLYQLPGLKTKCEAYLCENISPQNISDLLLLADQHQAPHLKATALHYCVQNHNYIMKTGSWAFIEENNPLLYEEAIASVADDLCDNHEDCIEKGGNRYNNMKGLHTHRNKNK